MQACAGGTLEGAPFGIAADQQRRPAQGRRQGLVRDGHRRLQRTAPFDGLRQVERLGAGLGTELALQRARAALERGQRRGPVAAQVVQPHDAPVRVLGGGVVQHEALRLFERGGELPFGFKARRLVRERLAAPRAPLAARLLDPVGELAAVAVVGRAEQIGGGARHGLCRRREVGLDTGGPGAASGPPGDDIAGGPASEPEHALAQAVRAALGIALGPEQADDAAARGRALDRQHRQHRGVATFEHVHVRAAHQARRADQFEPERSEAITGRFHARSALRCRRIAADDAPARERGVRRCCAHRPRRAPSGVASFFQNGACVFR